MISLETIKLLTTIAAVGGAISMGLVICKSSSDTKWRSKLGAWAMISLVTMTLGIFGWLYCIGVYSGITA